MVIYKLVNIKTLESIQSVCIIQGMRYGFLVEDGEEVCSANNAIDVDNRDVPFSAKIVRGYNPHPVVGVRLITKR